MRVVALCSGDRDSAYSLWLALKQGHKVVRVVAKAVTDTFISYIPATFLGAPEP